METPDKDTQSSREAFETFVIRCKRYDRSIRNIRHKGDLALRRRWQYFNYVFEYAYTQGDSPYNALLRAIAHRSNKVTQLIFGLPYVLQPSESTYPFAFAAGLFFGLTCLSCGSAVACFSYFTVANVIMAATIKVFVYSYLRLVFSAIFGDAAVRWLFVPLALFVFSFTTQIDTPGLATWCCSNLDALHSWVDFVKVLKAFPMPFSHGHYVDWLVRLAQAQPLAFCVLAFPFLPFLIKFAIKMFGGLQIVDTCVMTPLTSDIYTASAMLITCLF